jgi:putative ABC transport system permease protein
MPDTQFVSRDYLAAIGARIVAGRAFSEVDRLGQPQVMLVNETLARSGIAGPNPIGRRLYAYGDEPWEIIGIVEDVRQAAPEQPPDPQIFIDFRQVPISERVSGVGLYFVVRAEGEGDVLAGSIRSIVRSLDPRAIVDNIAPMDALVANAVVRPRLYAAVIGIFAGVAVVLAAIGIYGVVAFAVSQRTREIGIRVALGAERARVMTLVVGQTLFLVGVGLVLGVAGAAAVTRYLEGMLFGLTPLDPATFVSVCVTFSVVAVCASLVPARRATRFDPLVALRYE